MSPERWDELESLFHEIAELPLPDQRARLAAIEDRELRAEVAALVKAGKHTSGVATAISAIAGSAVTETLAPQKFGPWRVTGVLGHGGMGAVYRAVRDDRAFDKEVAVKALHSGLDGPLARERFRQERSILAGLEHPNIARLVDGGETEAGLSYIVMELVAGEPLTEWCERHAVSREERLKLFLQICAAVQYAHQQLVVHRDLKPGNILVTADGVPKLLDFGIAKLLDVDAIKTATGLQALTPAYASPEQILGTPVSTTSDVYSLGIVLYELLTGRRPYEVSTASPAATARSICETVPTKPNISGDLDNIILMALRKEPSRRYESVARMAEDIERSLTHRPVIARPDTVRYRTGKFVRRHWVAIAFAAALTITLTAGVAVSQYEARQAERRFGQVRKLANKFLFDFHDELIRVPGTTKARSMMVATALEYLDSLARDSARDPQPRPHQRGARLVPEGRAHRRGSRKARPSRYGETPHVAAPVLEDIDRAPKRRAVPGIRCRRRARRAGSGAALS
jgi:tRNA A-37 threonylcarbamoyl transferase component Bud32